MSLAGIGALAGGLSQGLQPYFQQLMQNPGSSDLGAALMSIYGGGQQTGQGGQQQGIGALMAPPAQQQVQAAPQASQAPQPTPAQLPPKAPPPMPMTAQPGTGVGAGATPMPSPAQPPGGGTAALAGQQQPQAPPPQQQMQRPAPQMQPGQTFDFDHLAGALAKTPGMTPQKMGRIVTSPGFARLLSVQGLQQYRALQGQLGRERTDQGWGRLGQGQERVDLSARKLKDTEGWHSQLLTWRKQQQGSATEVNSIRDAARGQRSAVNAQVFNGSMKPEEAQKQLAIIDEEETRKIGEIQKKIGEPPEAPKEESAGGGGDTSAIEEAKAAIAAGAPRRSD